MVFLGILLSSFITALGYGTFYYHHPVPLASLIGFALFFYLLKDFTWKKRLPYFLLWSFSLTLQCIYWIPHVLQVYGGVPKTLSFLALLIFAPFSMLYFYPWIFLKKIQRPIFLAFIFTLLEQFIPTFFPTYINLNIYSFLHYFPAVSQGFYLTLSFVLYYFVFSLAYKRDRENSITNGLLVFFVLNFWFLPPKPSQTTPITLVQHNNEVNVLWSLSKNIPEHQKIIFWPESVFNFYPNFKADFLKPHQHLIFGTSEKTYNSVFHYHQNEIKNKYYKMFLMPFGEKIPFFLLPLKSFFLQYFTPREAGTSWTIFNIDGLKFLTPICYEVLKPLSLGWIMEKESLDFLVAPTDDSWYGKSAELQQHKYLAHLTGIFLGLPIVRPTSTGITQVLYPTGKMSSFVGYEEKNNLHHDLETTPVKYPLRKNFFYLLLAFLILWGSEYLSFFKKKKT